MTETLEWHFGYNCEHFLPTIGKCRRLIGRYGSREDLVERRWLSTHELLVYLNLPEERLLTEVISGEIKTKIQKDGKVVFEVSTSWKYDDCFLVCSGGQCLYFEKHKGKIISCLAELTGSKREHPNRGRAPSEAEVAMFQDAVIKINTSP